MVWADFCSDVIGTEVGSPEKPMLEDDSVVVVMGMCLDEGLIFVTTREKWKTGRGINTMNWLDGITCLEVKTIEQREHTSLCSETFFSFFLLLFSFLVVSGWAVSFGKGVSSFFSRTSGWAVSFGKGVSSFFPLVFLLRSASHIKAQKPNEYAWFSLAKE